MTDSFWANRRVFVTGHTGFKGSWLLFWLIKLGAKVACLSLPPDEEKVLFTDAFKNSEYSYSFDQVFENILSLDALKDYVSSFKPDIVFHLAAQPLVSVSYQNPVDTWTTNVIGSLHVLEAMKTLDKKCAVVMITTDKVYENREWDYGYRETDRLGGFDPYSSSKAAAEIAISSWRSSFCHDNLNNQLLVATARAGNVIGGGDWSSNRLIPDLVRSTLSKSHLTLRYPEATRPWNHVLEPLSGYLLLAKSLYLSQNPPCEPFNFGPSAASNRSVLEIVNCFQKYWPSMKPTLELKHRQHEAHKLHLQSEKAYRILGWKTLWDFDQTVSRTADWYRKNALGRSAVQCMNDDLEEYQELCTAAGVIHQ